MNPAEFAYPQKLIPSIKAQWALTDKGEEGEDKGELLPSDTVMKQLLDIAYHAGLQREENRPLRFSILYIGPREIVDKATEFNAEDESGSAISFANPRPLTVAELVRIAPAINPAHTIVAVHGTPDRLQIWGLIHTGLSWHELMRHERRFSYGLPDGLLITATRPGSLRVERGGIVLASLRDGTISSPTLSVLERGPIGQYFKESERALMTDVANAFVEEGMTPLSRADGHTHWYSQFLERILIATRDLGHGGSFLFVPDSFDLTDSRLTDRLNVKYALGYQRPWAALVQDVLGVQRQYLLHQDCSAKQTVSKTLFEKYCNAERHHDDSNLATRDCLQFLASITLVDGAVVLTPHLRLIGFGAEIVVQSPTLSRVLIAQDANAKATVERSIQEFGTRHRSVIRFCSSYEDAVGFVVSQDGGVRAVKRVGRDVVVWPDLALANETLTAEGELAD